MRVLLIAAFCLAAACSAPADPKPASGTSERGLRRRLLLVHRKRFRQNARRVWRPSRAITGGRTANPTYEQVSAGGTGHIEAVRVIYDPRRISYAQLVTRFLPTIDPSTAAASSATAASSIARRSSSPTPAERRTAEAAQARPRGGLGSRSRSLILPASAFYAGRGLSSGLLQEESGPL